MQKREIMKLLMNVVLPSILVFGQLAESRRVLTIGGGVAAGTGTYTRLHDYTVPKEDWRRCAREPNEAPGKALAVSESIPAANLACFGASIQDTIGQWEEALATYGGDWAGSTVIVSAGLDDIVTENGRWTWRSLLNWCELEPLPFIYECHFERGNNIGNASEIEAKLTELISSISQEASGARIRVLGFGKVYQPPQDGRCASIGMNNPESRFIDGLVQQINEILAGIVSQVASSTTSVDIGFVDMDNYITVGNCDGIFSEKRQIVGVVIQWLPIPLVSVASYHPTNFGYKAYDQALADSL